MKVGDRVILKESLGTILEVQDTEFLHKNFIQIEVKISDPMYLVKLDNGLSLWTKNITKVIEI